MNALPAMGPGLILNTTDGHGVSSGVIPDHIAKSKGLSTTRYGPDPTAPLQKNLRQQQQQKPVLKELRYK